MIFNLVVAATSIIQRCYVAYLQSQKFNYESTGTGRMQGTCQVVIQKVLQAMLLECPEDSILAAGCSIRISGSHPESTTLAEGFNVGMSGGRLENSTLAAGCSIRISGSHPESTTLAEGYKVGMSGGRPKVTTLDRGHSIILRGIVYIY